MSTSVLIRGGRVVEDDFILLADDVEWPQDQPVIVSLARWERDRDAPVSRASFGVRLPNTADVRVLNPALLQVQAIVLEFPGISDGRAYSQARLLREALAYRGEIRATGAAVVRDQLLGMVRCGIDAFELRADQSPEGCIQALHEFSLAYQPGVANDPLSQVRPRRRTAAG
ncbi:MAG: DUF934 domain-containing protein [Panacagrimonas sp.]